MLHCNPRIKITSEKKGIFFHILFTRYEQTISVRAIFITIDSKVPLKVLIINERKDTNHKYQQLHTLQGKACHWI